MDIYRRIREDHDTQRDLFKQLKQTDKLQVAERRRLFRRLRAELWAHARIEELVFYAPLRGPSQTREEFFEGVTEHRLIDQTLEDLNTVDADSDAWTAKLDVLEEVTRHHIDEEEEKFFDKARQVIDDAQAREMGDDFAARKAKVVEALTG